MTSNAWRPIAHHPALEAETILEVSLLAALLEGAHARKTLFLARRFGAFFFGFFTGLGGELIFEVSGLLLLLEDIERFQGH